MKIAMITFGVIVLLFLIFQFYVAMSIDKTELQMYDVVQTEKEFEIRFYPPATLASITTPSTSYRNLGTAGFKQLAKYIFGGNREKKQIAMTAPVHMEMSDSVAKMSFVMPAHYSLQSLPAPDDSNVTISMVPEEYVAAIRFDGFATTEKINEKTARLQQLLNEKQISHYGNFRYLGYNPPYQLIGRRNEIIVAIHHF